MGEPPAFLQATPARAQGAEPRPPAGHAHPAPGWGPQERPRGALTFVAPVDAGDLDLLRGDVILHKLLALQPVPQCCLARVPVPADHDLHWERAQVRQTVRAKGRLPPPRACTHTTCTRVPLCPRAGSPGLSRAPRAADGHLGGRTQDGSLQGRRGCELTPTALCVPRLPFTCLPAALVSWVQDAGFLMTAWGDGRKPGFYLAAQPLFRRGVLTHTPRMTGRAGDRMGTCLRGKVPRCLRRVGFLPPAEKAGAWPKTSRELGSSAEPAGQGGADGHGWAAGPLGRDAGQPAGTHSGGHQPGWAASLWHRGPGRPGPGGTDAVCLARSLFRGLSSKFSAEGHEVTCNVLCSRTAWLQVCTLYPS